MDNTKPHLSQAELNQLAERIKNKAHEFGFQQAGITDNNLDIHVERYKNWLDQGMHGDLDYMEKHGSKRWTADELIPGTLRVISLRMNYLTQPDSPLGLLNEANKAYISRYSLGRDYHKLIRSRLKKLIAYIKEEAKQHNFRAFVDSAPVLERAFAQKSGLGWFGKNTMLINRTAGSWFFLGEIYTDLPLPSDTEYSEEHCGSCTACLKACPTDAFKGPYLLDAQRCISYLTIELKGSIPIELREKIGNRIFGCDDCQLVCPWNKFSKPSTELDFSPRNKLDDISLLELFSWSEAVFLSKTEGSAIRRAGYESWRRNIAVALGNAPHSAQIVESLLAAREQASDLLTEHIDWALKQQKGQASIMHSVSAQPD
jgi:epoxyqueuosine reductase